MEVVFKQLKLTVNIPLPLQIELLRKSVDKENIHLAVEEWEWVVGDIELTTNYQAGAIYDFKTIKGRCVCGCPLRWVYQIRNKLNGILIPENPCIDDGIGCICLLTFLPAGKEKYKLLKQEQNERKKIEEERKKKEEEAIDRIKNRRLYCCKCDSFLKGKLYCKKCLDDKFNCSIIGCKRKKYKLSMCRTCCKKRKLL